MGASSLLLLALGTCTTEKPHEIFKRTAVPGSSPGAAPSSGAAGGAGGSSGGASATGGTTPQGGDAGTETGGSGGKGGTGNASSGGRDASGGKGGSGATGASGGPDAVGGTGAEQSGAGAGGEDGEVEPVDLCGDAPVTTADPFTREALRAAAAACGEWHYCRFDAAATKLEETVRAQADEPSSAHLADTQAAWRSAMAIWLTIELFQFGPVASRAESAGKDGYQGQGIRERLYSWPLTAHCRVDEQIVNPTYTQGFANVPLTARGLFGLEVLLFYTGNETACASVTPSAKTWATLGASEIGSRRRAYAVALSANVQDEIEALRALWRPDGGNFRQTFVSASGYPSETEAMSTLAWALVYAERELKDWKLGVPAGYTLMHPVTGPEAPYAGVGTENIRENLRGFQGLFQGCGPNGEGVGFDDWLVSIGHGDLAAELLSALSNARAAADAAKPLGAMTPAEVGALYLVVKGLTDVLKSEFFGPASPLNLELPQGVASDTD